MSSDGGCHCAAKGSVVAPSAAREGSDGDQDSDECNSKRD
jgi:hypothetical protein